MKDKNAERSKLLFKTYLEVYLIYNNTQYPEELFGSFHMGRPMLMAFVCELGFKALILQDGGKYGNTHLLNKLFDLLSPQKQQSIIQILEIEETEFRKLLSKNVSIFTKWRYFTEELSSCSADTKFIEKLINSVALFLLEDSFWENLSRYFPKNV